MPDTRPPAASGTFYPALPGRLRADVRRYLEMANTTARRVRAVLAPHAGYMYSGAVAGSAFAAAEIPNTCVLIGPSHSADAYGRETGAILLETSYRTPLGAVPVDVELGTVIMKAAGGMLIEDAAAHAREHCLEVLLPFLQVRNPEVRIVPILFDGGDWERARTLARAIASSVRRRDDVLIVASSDMNHFEPAALTVDKDTMVLDRIITTDGEGLLDTANEHRIAMCGRIPVACALEASRELGAHVGEVVGYGHSGVVDGRDDRVVGYAAALIGIA